MKFFIDNNISEKIAKGLQAFGENVIHLKEKFPEDTSDEVWLKYVGENNFILITKDEKIRYNPAEIKAFRKYKVGAFFLGGKNLDRWGRVRQVVINWPKIKEESRKHNRPFAFRIPPTGTMYKKLPI